MKPSELRAARIAKGWTQTQAAARLGMTQAYLNFLEHGKRRLTPELVRRVTSVYGLSPEVLPVPDSFMPAPTDNQRLTEFLAKLGYPGFSYLHSRAAKKHPYEVLLTALAQRSLDGRVAEALPWVAMKYAQPDPCGTGPGSSSYPQTQVERINALKVDVANYSKAIIDSIKHTCCTELIRAFTMCIPGPTGTPNERGGKQCPALLSQMAADPSGSPRRNASALSSISAGSRDWFHVSLSIDQRKDSDCRVASD